MSWLRHYHGFKQDDGDSREIERLLVSKRTPYLFSNTWSNRADVDATRCHGSQLYSSTIRKSRYSRKQRWYRPLWTDAMCTCYDAPIAVLLPQKLSQMWTCWCNLIVKSERSRKAIWSLRIPHRLTQPSRSQQNIVQDRRLLHLLCWSPGWPLSKEIGG